MLSSITPLGERGRNRSWRTTAAAYVVGSIAGGTATGLLFGALGAAIGTWWTPPAGPTVFTLAGLFAVAALHESGLLGFRLPSIKRQVNEDWLEEYRGWVVGIGFGFQLGAGLTTIVTSAAMYLVWVAAALTFSLGGGMVIGAVFGLVRALPLLATRHIDSPTRLRRWHEAMHRFARRARRGVVTVTAVGAVALAFVGLAA